MEQCIGTHNFNSVDTSSLVDALTHDDLPANIFYAPPVTLGDLDDIAMAGKST